MDEADETGAKMLDTRKTVPGLRILDKYAVCCGGGENHRLDFRWNSDQEQPHFSRRRNRKGAGARAKGAEPGQTIDIEVRNVEELEAGAGPRGRIAAAG